MLLYELSAVLSTPMGVGVIFGAVIILSGIMNLLGGRNER